MNLRDYAQQQRQDIKPPINATAPTPDSNPIAAAQKIITTHKQSHEIAEGCRLQILQDIERKENPFKLLLYAAEAIGRLDFQGDNFYLQVQKKLVDVYGHDPSEENFSQKV